MAKKEFLEKKLPKEKENLSLNDPAPDISGDFSNRVSGFSSRAFGIVKFILGLALLPFVFSSAASFLNEFSLVNGNFQ